MKPVEKLPLMYGDKMAERYEEVQAFLANGCKYCEAKAVGTTIKGDLTGYYAVIKKYGLDGVKPHNINNKIYLERL